MSVIIFGRGRVSRDNFHLADRLCQMEKCIKDTCAPGEGCLPIRPDGKFMTTIFFFFWGGGGGGESSLCYRYSLCLPES